MVERHTEQIVDGVFLSYRQLEEMAPMLGCRSNHLGAEQAPDLTRSIEPERSVVFLHRASPALCGELDLADGCCLWIEFAGSLTDRSDLRIGEYDTQRGASGEAIGFLLVAFKPSDIAVVGSFMKQGPLSVGVTGQEDRRVADPHRLRIDLWHAL